MTEPLLVGDVAARAARRRSSAAAVVAGLLLPRPHRLVVVPGRAVTDPRVRGQGRSSTRTVQLGEHRRPSGSSTAASVPYGRAGHHRGHPRTHSRTRDAARCGRRRPRAASKAATSSSASLMIATPYRHRHDADDGCATIGQVQGRATVDPRIRAWPRRRNRDPRRVVVRGGVIADVLPRRRRHAGRRCRRRAARRPGAAARPGRQPRARQRARAHRVGGLRDRDRRGRGRRRHHDRRHAAQQHPADRSTSRRWRRSARRPRGQLAVDVAFWGGAVPGNAGAAAPHCTTPGSSGSSASCCPPGWTSSRRSTATGWRGDAHDRRLRRAAHRPRRGRAA